MDEKMIGQMIKEKMAELTESFSKANPGDSLLYASSDDVKMHDLGLKSVSNARQLGGYITKEGKVIKRDKLLRTANLHHISEEDLHKLEEIYHLKLVVDLRSNEEHVKMPDQLPEGAHLLWVNPIEKAMNQMPQNKSSMDEEKIKAFMACKDSMDFLFFQCQSPSMQYFIANMYTIMLANESSQEAYRTMFHEILAQKGECVLWHCAQGKDRCGLGSVLILAALGCDDELILDDFSRSNIYYGGLVDRCLPLAKEKGCDENTIECIKAMLAVNTSYMEKAIAFANENYGSLYNYLIKGLGLSEEEISTLRSYYLD